jgi:hypothetical protein
MAVRDIAARNDFLFNSVKIINNNAYVQRAAQLWYFAPAGVGVFGGVKKAR